MKNKSKNAEFLRRHARISRFFIPGRAPPPWRPRLRRPAALAAPRPRGCAGAVDPWRLSMARRPGARWPRRCGPGPLLAQDRGARPPAHCRPAVTGLADESGMARGRPSPADGTAAAGGAVPNAARRLAPWWAWRPGRALGAAFSLVQRPRPAAGPPGVCAAWLRAPRLRGGRHPPSARPGCRRKASAASANRPPWAPAAPAGRWGPAARWPPGP